MPPVRKNQHYVWQHYLRAWTSGGKIACYRQGERKRFSTSTANIGSETYFYRTPVLTERERSYLDRVIGSRPEHVREAHRGTLEMFSLITEMRSILDGSDSPDAANRRQAEEVLAYAERVLGEQYHGAIEDAGLPLLARLRGGDASFWRNDDDRDASVFAYFIATQYVRTARMRNAVSDAVTGAVAADGIDIARVWTIESHFWATEIGLALLTRRDRYRALILGNASDVPFIAGDQPVINLNPSTEPDVKLYYPVSPSVALLLTADPDEEERDVGRLEAERLNHAIYAWSDDQIYGLDESYLEEMGGLAKSLRA